MSRPENRIRGMGVALIQYQSFTGGDARLATVLRDNVASALDCSLCALDCSLFPLGQ